MRTEWRRDPRWGEQRGAALVEFSLVIVLFVALLYGLISYGLLFALKQSITNAANEGARASIAGGVAASYDTAEDGLRWLGDKCCRRPAELTGEPLVIDATEGPCNAVVIDGPDCVTVVVTYDYASIPLLPGLGFALPDTITSTGVIQVPPAPVA